MTLRRAGLVAEHFSDDGRRRLRGQLSDGGGSRGLRLRPQGRQPEPETGRVQRQGAVSAGEEPWTVGVRGGGATRLREVVEQDLVERCGDRGGRLPELDLKMACVIAPDVVGLELDDARDGLGVQQQKGQQDAVHAVESLVGGRTVQPAEPLALAERYPVGAVPGRNAQAVGAVGAGSPLQECHDGGPLPVGCDGDPCVEIGLAQRLQGLVSVAEPGEALRRPWPLTCGDASVHADASPACHQASPAAHLC